MLLIVGCQKTEKQYHIGVSQCSDDAWRNKLNTEMRIGGYYYTNLDISIASAQDNDDLQIQQIDSLVDAGVDLLIVSPNKLSTMSDAIDRAYDKGIPVILLDRKKQISQNIQLLLARTTMKLDAPMGGYVAGQTQRKRECGGDYGIRWFFTCR